MATFPKARTRISSQSNLSQQNAAIAASNQSFFDINTPRALARRKSSAKIRSHVPRSFFVHAIIQSRSSAGIV
jgi:hypothetical protein